MTGIEIAQRAKEQLAQLTGLTVDTVSGFDKRDEGWRVTVELVELKRIPDATDVLATYETVLDDEGNVLNYQRIRRYLRGQIMEEESFG
ncbi:MAG: gas vesicle protein [Anaerolineae bacterium]|nr:gas vesicle protein [Anaerolineae bacterium]